MEEDKILYLKSFLIRTEVSLEFYAEFIKERELKARNHYDETLHYIESSQFLEMIMVDVAFVIELLWKNYMTFEIEENDRIFNRPLKLAAIRHDMMLLENQLPFFLLEDVFTMAKLNIPSSSEKESLIRTTHKFFKAKAYLAEEEQVLQKFQKMDQILHFVDFFRKCHLPTKPPPPDRRIIGTVTVPSVMELHRAGVKLQESPTKNLLDIQFSKGTLKIPHLRKRLSRKSSIMNMSAFEQCHLFDSYIGDCVFITDRLIGNTMDVDTVVKNKVIFDSMLPDDNQELVTSIQKFKDLCDELNVYCTSPWNTFRTTIYRKYFSSPVTVFAVAVATALFILTLLQTVCSCGVQFK